MTVIMLTTLIQLLAFAAGTILMYYAGKQDEKTRRPLLLIPALMAIGLSAGLTTFLIISLASFIIFFLPEKTNKVMGKADLLLFASALMIIILNQNPILTITIYITLAITIILILLEKKLKKQVPLIHYYARAHLLSIIILIGSALGIIIGGLL